MVLTLQALSTSIYCCCSEIRLLVHIKEEDIRPHTITAKLLATAEERVEMCLEIHNLAILSS